VGHQAAVLVAPGCQQNASNHYLEGAIAAEHCLYHGCHACDLASIDWTTNRFHFGI
jgi:hypothetical protein